MKNPSLQTISIEECFAIALKGGMQLDSELDGCPLLSSYVILLYKVRGFDNWPL